MRMRGRLWTQLPAARILAVCLVFALGLALFGAAGPAYAQSGGQKASAAKKVTSLRLGAHGPDTRFVIEMPQGVAYQVFTLADPYRVVIDLPATDFDLAGDIGHTGVGVVSGYRFGQFQAGKSRIVLDVAAPVEIVKNFTLPPQSGFGHRIVLDLGPTSRETFLAKAGWPADFRAASLAPDASPVAPPLEKSDESDRRKLIVIDPGHGGVDPGARGYNGAQEKDVVLRFSHELRRHLEASGRYVVHMTRDRDEFIRLRDRVEFARKRNADLFLSIHADSIEKSAVRGMSVYTLSENASDKEAAELAQKENLADVIAGIDLQGESSEVTDILIDLAQRETKNLSVRFAKSAIDYAGKSTLLLQRSHRFAGFRVLKAPDVPSVLVELGFLTNRDDERQLTSPSWRKKVAASLAAAIDSYFGGRYAEGAR